MSLNRLLSTAAALALLAGAAQAQTPDPAAAPAPTAAPAPAAAPPAAEAPAAAATPQLVAHGNIIDTLKAAGQFKMTLKALDVTGILPVLRSPGPLAFLAPTDAAFAALPPETRTQLLLPENAETLQKVMVYHLINTAMDPSKINGTKGQVKTVEGDYVNIDGSGEHLMFNDATVENEAVPASNGIIYVIDRVLLPPGGVAAVLPDKSRMNVYPPAMQPPVTAPKPGTAGMAANTAGAQGQNAAAQAETPVPTDPSAGPATVTAPAAPAASDPNAPMAGMAMTPAPASANGEPMAGQPGVVSNGPVPDTAESRANNGEPMSNAGKETPPAGN